MEFVVIQTYLNTIEAEVAKSALEAAGIVSMIRSDDCGVMQPSLQMGGVDLLVRAEDAEAAEEILLAAAVEESETETEDPDI